MKLIKTTFDQVKQTHYFFANDATDNTLQLFQRADNKIPNSCIRDRDAAIFIGRSSEEVYLIDYEVE